MLVNPPRCCRERGPGRAGHRRWTGGLAVALAIASISAALAHGADRTPQLPASSRPQSGIASYYGSNSAGKPTASGAPFSPNHMTAASPTLPLGTKAKVTNTDNGKSANVVVTDRGPFVKHRILDVSPKAARRLGMKSKGVSKVKVQPLPPKSHP